MMATLLLMSPGECVYEHNQHNYYQSCIYIQLLCSGIRLIP